MSPSRRISVAPMMDYTDRHCRYLMRLLSPSALLYTEMVTADAVLRGDTERLLGFDPAERPVALQLGGHDAVTLAGAARIGAQAGYDEINLNCGCPSDRVREGRFGACLMDEPERVADIVAAMQSSVAVPVTVKCRIGIEPTASALDDYDYLVDFVAAVARRGCRTFIVHARKAILSGLSPKQNREVPPLRHEIVRRLKADFPELEIVLNGGVRSVAEVRSHLDALDGVMIGREAYQNPYLLTDLHTAIVDRYFASPTREAVVRAYLPYVASQFERGVRLNALTRPLLGLYFGQQGARAWRRYLSEQSRTCPDPRFLLDSLRLVAAAA